LHVGFNGGFGVWVVIHGSFLELWREFPEMAARDGIILTLVLNIVVVLLWNLAANY